MVVQDVPKVLKGRAVPALMATGRVMGAYGMTFAAVGGIFAAVDVRTPLSPFAQLCALVIISFN